MDAATAAIREGATRAALELLRAEHPDVVWSVVDDAEGEE